LIAKGRVDHAYIGIQMRSLTPAVREVINAEAPRDRQITAETGVIILGVQPDSPAARAGLRAGDVIVTLGGQAVQDAEAVQSVVQATEIGDPLTLMIDRQGERLEITLRPAALPIG
ncbi:MAG TPA: PDZ domain-containing protein, partial [Candidatus Obscuribacterales bacterium]